MSSSKTKILIVCGALAVAGIGLILAMGKDDDEKENEPKPDETSNKVQQDESIDAITKSYALTEMAANSDPKIAEKSRQIAQPTQEEQASAQKEQQPAHQAKKIDAEVSVSRATNDTAVAEEDQKTVEETKIQSSQQDLSPVSSTDENKNRQNNRRRNNKLKKKVTTQEAQNDIASPSKIATMLKGKSKGAKNKKKSHQGSAAAAAVKEIKNFQAGNKKKKSKSKNHQ